MEACEVHSVLSLAIADLMTATVGLGAAIDGLVDEISLIRAARPDLVPSGPSDFALRLEARQRSR